MIIQLDEGWNRIKRMVRDGKEGVLLFHSGPRTPASDTKTVRSAPPSPPPSLFTLLSLGHRRIDDGLGASFKMDPTVEIRAFTLCYDMCTQRNPFNWTRDLYIRYGETIETYLRDTVHPAIQHATTALGGGTILLNEVRYRWNNHQIMITWLRRIFRHIDRYYVIHHSLPRLMDVGTRLFKTEIYQNYKEDITMAILMLIDQDRHGEIIDKTLVHDMMKLYECMGMRSLEAYATDLELPFLESTRAYYRKKRVEWIDNTRNESIPDYLIKVERAHEEEQRRVAEYLHLSTESRVRAVVEDELMFVGFVLLLSGRSL